MPEDMGGDHNPFLEEQGFIRDLWRHTPINRYYLPISRLPPMDAPDPRRHFAGQPPECYADHSVPRASRIIERWRSMPQLRSQLPAEDLEDIMAGEQAARERLRRAREARTQSRCGSAGDGAGCGGACPGRSQCRAAGGDSRETGGGGPRDFPHVKCSCCEHPQPKPWMRQKTLGAAMSSLIDEVMPPPL